MACTLDMGLRDTHRIYALGCPTRGNSGPPNSVALLQDSFIDIVRQNWPRNAGLCTPLQQTVIQRDPPLWWPQLSHIAWFSEKSYTYHLIKRPFPATLLDLLSILQSGENISKRLGGIIGCKYKTSLWHLNGFPYGSNLGSTV